MEGLGNRVKSWANTPWFVIVISMESFKAGLDTDTAFAHTVPLVKAVTRPAELIVAVPLTGTILQLTTWLAVEGKIVATI